MANEKITQASLQDIYSSINNVLKNIKTNDITSESSDSFSQLPDGYYLAELVKAELKTSKSSGAPMVAWQFKTVENGVCFDGDLTRTSINKSKGKVLFLYHSLKDESAMERFISDALKFEGEEPGKSLLEKEYFENAEVLHDALDVLIGSYIWLHVDTDKDNNTWTRIVSWKRAAKLELV